MTEPSVDELNATATEAYLLLRKGDYAKSGELFERVFEWSPQTVAVYLGYIFSEIKNPERDLAKAARYLEIAIEYKDGYALCLLGVFLDKLGKSDEALVRLMEGSRFGYGACSYFACRIFEARGDAKQSIHFLEKAVKQDDPVAIQYYSIQQIKGRFGAKAILQGLISYLRNLPRLFRHIKTNYLDN